MRIVAPSMNARCTLELANQWTTSSNNGKNRKQFDADRHKVLGQPCFSSVPALSQCGRAGVFIGNEGPPSPAKDN